MICTVCNTEGIKNVANQKEFYFCPNCRDEIKLVEVEYKPEISYSHYAARNFNSYNPHGPLKQNTINNEEDEDEYYD